MSAEAGRQSPRANAASHFPDAILAIDIDEIDGKAHEEGVHRFAGSDPQTLTGQKALPAQQTFSSCGCGMRFGELCGQHRAAGQV
jgi:hypothetical protein